MARLLLGERVGDLLQLVSRPRVLRLRVVVEIDHAAFVDRDVLEDRSECARRLPDLRLRVGRQTDDLRVAPALDVEDASIAPAMLVVADQPAPRIG